jgi:hypothetical protein
MNNCKVIRHVVYVSTLNISKHIRDDSGCSLRVGDGELVHKTFAGRSGATRRHPPVPGHDDNVSGVMRNLI